MPRRSPADLVRAGFPGALPVEDFATRWEQACAEAGHRADTSLLVVGVCRDELCFPFVARLEAVWGPAFHAGSLGGLLTIGRTGIAAAAHHAPQGPGQPLRYVVVAAAHIGMEADGTFGYLRREHQPRSSRACGALMAFRDELLTSRLRLGYDPADPEMSLLRQRIFSALSYGDIPDPVRLTALVADVIDEDLRDLLGDLAAALGDEQEVLVAVVTGVLVHTPGGDWFSPHAPRLWSSRSGERPLDLGLGPTPPGAGAAVVRSGGTGFPATE